MSVEIMPSEVTPLEPELADAFRHLDPGQVRSMREFADEEIWLPESEAGGRWGGDRYRSDRVPAMGLILDAMSSGNWTRYFILGPVQSGKTLHGQVIPCLYHLFEIGEGVIFGGPTSKLACGIFQDKVRPVIESSFPDMWPTSGKGSQGGITDEIEFRNGAKVRFMGAGGGDEAVSSHTSRVVVLTEIDKMGSSSDSSQETSPFKKFESRTKSFGERARIYGECTVTNEQGAIWNEVTQRGTHTKVGIRCPECEKWHIPTRDQLKGWRGAETEDEAWDSTVYECPHCEAGWDEDARDKAIQHVVPVHDGQELDSNTGEVTGEQKRTRTFGFHYNFVHAPLIPLGDTGSEEWILAKKDTDDQKKYVMQYLWALPFTPEQNTKQLSMSLLARHCHDGFHFDPLAVVRDGQKYQMPKAADVVVGSVDIQREWLYYYIMGSAQDLTTWSLIWGVERMIPEGSPHDPTERDLRRALDQTRVYFDAYDCDSSWYDVGYKHESSTQHTIRRWCDEMGASVHAVVGRGSSQMNMRGKRLKIPDGAPSYIRCCLQDDGTKLWFFDVWRLKDEWHSRLFRTEGSPGYWYFPREAANRKKNGRSQKGDPATEAVGWIFRHYTSVQRTIEVQDDGTEKRVWKEGRRVDMVDCTCYALGGSMLTWAEKEANKNKSKSKNTNHSSSKRTSTRQRVRDSSDRIRTTY